MLAAIVCLIFVAHTARATEEPGLQRSYKTTLISLGKEAGRMLISNARQRPDVMFVCGLVLAGAGSFILLKTIMSDLPKILGSTAMIGSGIALVFFTNNAPRVLTRGIVHKDLADSSPGLKADGVFSAGNKKDSQSELSS